jgi:hypothetical protein
MNKLINAFVLFLLGLYTIFLIFMMMTVGLVFFIMVGELGLWIKYFARLFDPYFYFINKLEKDEQNPKVH